ncbi:MAG: hypothetical protein ACXVB1_06690 [Pseudobdellovibrionaceae bacterium]
MTKNVQSKFHEETHQEINSEGNFFFIILLLTLLMAIQGNAQEGSPRSPTPLDSILDPIGASAAPTPWRVTKAEWGLVDEENYIRYISMVGEGVAKGYCATVRDCFRNSRVNPYAATNPPGLRFFSDCADFPYFLRAYFAWQNELPFGFVASVSPIQGKDTIIKDIRYSPYGNVVESRYSVIARKSTLGRHKYPNALDIFNNTLPNDVSSATYRVSYKGMDADNRYSDLYPVKVTREGILPGTVVYDPNGHVVTIYKVTDDGRLYYIDAHPDNSLTSGLYNSRFIRSYPGQGAGFKNWRPLRLVGATWEGSFGYFGGKIVGAKDRDLPLFSTEQYYGTSATPDWKQAQFVFQGRTMDYYDWVRNRLANGPLVENPLDDVKIMTQELCNGMKERAIAVQVAVSAGFHLREHPFRLPNNIFGANGDWETYATPARDARLKVAFKELRTYVEESLNHYKSRDGKVSYNGTNLAGDMLKVYKQTAGSCLITYKNSQGRSVSMNLEEARVRAYKLSFDPYHCPELRWGAQGKELNSCRDNSEKRLWYEREQWLRNQHERNTDAFTGFSVNELTGPKPGAGVANGQDLDVIAFLSKNH